MLDSLGLFDTLVPISSIVTVACLLALVPRHERFGLFFLGWWALSVVISLQTVDKSAGDNERSFLIFASAARWSPYSDSNRGDGWGMVIMIGMPFTMLSALYFWFNHHINIRMFVYREVPLWSMTALHIYRLDGLSVVYPFWKNQVIPKYLGIQTMLLDVLIGAAAIPITWILYAQGVQCLSSRQCSTGWLKEAFWFWNSLGLYDLLSAYIVFLFNYFQIGGSYITTPALSLLGFHPLPLIVLFQAPLAIAIHVYLLTNINHVVDYQLKNGSILPTHVVRIRNVAK